MAEPWVYVVLAVGVAMMTRTEFALRRFRRRVERHERKKLVKLLDARREQLLRGGRPYR